VNLDYLKTYLLLVKMGSFSGVAKKLSISQPAVSFQIQRLEHDLGTRLINRSQKKITLTEAGKRLLAFAQSVNTDEERLLGDIARLREEVGGELLIAASTTPGELLLPALMGEFIALHSAVKSQIIVRDSMDVINGVHEGSYEVGFCGAVPSPHFGLESFRIAGDNIVLIVYPDHPLALKRKVKLADIQHEPFIVREPTSGTQKTLEGLLAKEGLTASHLTQRLIVGSSLAVLSAVEARAGIAFISDLAIKKALELETVKKIELDDLSLKRDFFCIYYAERMASRLLQEFIAFVRERTAIV
jgi:LysR family transcriptional regulator, transcriptional activator of the cysJI operon